MEALHHDAYDDRIGHVSVYNLVICDLFYRVPQFTKLCSIVEHAQRLHKMKP